MVKDAYCECGQYLTTYFMVICKCMGIGGVAHGLPCPAKGCTKTYTLERTEEDSDGEG